MFIFQDVLSFPFSRASPRVVVNEFWTNTSTIPSIIEFDELSPSTSYLITVAVSINGTINGTRGPPTRELAVTTLSDSNFTFFLLCLIKNILSGS